MRKIGKIAKDNLKFNFSGDTNNYRNSFTHVER